MSEKIKKTASENISSGMVKSLNGHQMKSMVEAGTLWLKTNAQIVNALNVFPVPDGDTGTNMLLTMQSAWHDIVSIDESKAGTVMKKVAQGALMGARGNSGVILSQFWRGFSRAVENSATVDMESFSKALNEAKITAYKGVVRPVEGTILTVLKDTAAAAEAGWQNCSNMNEMLDLILKAADESVERTPDLLPVLKQAGVVDSGGKGLFYIFEGFRRWLNNEPLDVNPDLIEIKSLEGMEMQDEEIEPGQDYEVVVDFIPKGELSLSAFYDRLSDIGVSIQVGEGDGMYRMHIHVPAENLFAPVTYIQTLGTVTKVMIENLVAQMEEIRSKKAVEYVLPEVESGQIAVVAVSPGEGISKILVSLGAAIIVQGGQTMNPSTEEILTAIENLPTDKVIVLPNNKNIILSAQNAATQTKKKIAVIRSKNIPQGVSALLHLDPEGDFDEIVAEMDRALTDVETGEITVATRSVELNGVSVQEGQIIALHNGSLILAENSVDVALNGFLTAAKAAEYERIALFYGSNIPKEQALEIAADVQTQYPNHEIECHYGGQPHYYFIVAVE